MARNSPRNQGLLPRSEDDGRSPAAVPMTCVVWECKSVVQWCQPMCAPCRRSLIIGDFQLPLVMFAAPPLSLATDPHALLDDQSHEHVAPVLGTPRER